MRISIAATALCLAFMTGNTFAQPGPPPDGPPGGPRNGQFPGPPPGGPRGGPPGGQRGAAKNGAQSLVTRMLAFDKNDDQQLTAEEVTDQRLQRLFRRADADKDGTVTKSELTALGKTMASEFPNAGRRGGPGGGGPGGGPGGPGGGPGRGPRGFGGPGGPPPGGSNDTPEQEQTSGRRRPRQQ